jgi:CRP-like cAMP-binding protein/Fe-S-cluster-containing hydrogenase component 2
VEIPARAAENAARVVFVNAPPLPGAIHFPRGELKALPFLGGLSDQELDSLAPAIWSKTFARDETVLQAGAYGDAAFYIVSGSAAVRVRTLADGGETPRRTEGAGGRIRKLFTRAQSRTGGASTGGSGDSRSGSPMVLHDLPVAVRPGGESRLEAGAIFGEISALSRYPHSSDVVALTEMRCAVLPTPVLRRLMSEVEAFGELIDRLYVERTLDEHLTRVELLAALPKESRDALRANAELLQFAPGDAIVAQGDPVDAFLLVRGGHVKVAVQEADRDLAVTYLRKGDHTGEIGLLLDQPWPFSLTALEHVELVRIGRDAFQQVLADAPAIEDQLWRSAVARLKERGFAAGNPESVEPLRRAMDTGLIHGESVLLIDLNTCTKCDDCVRACADTHGGTPRFVREGIRVSHYSVPTACYQCTDPVCMIGCPTGAISRPLGTLQVVINQATCIGCHRCVNGCPWHNIVPVPYYNADLGQHIQLATKCDLCVGRREGPACVQMCPHGAAVRVDFKDPAVVRTLLSAS